jgi:mRNA interferase RelE/StbE
VYEVILSFSVEKFIDKLDSKERERIIFALERLRILPERYLKRLVGEQCYKFRVWDYRLIVDLKTDKLLVLVVKIGYRKNIYKSLN